ncbi:MAG: hypothetical protein VKM34_02095, partial [Cyanobacteriota bacterium]|nr:hypothetical protein [Cyanobacteriota bacterium]
ADAGQVSPTGPGEKTDPCPSLVASRPTDSTRRSDSPASGSPTNGAGARPSAQPAEVLFRLVGRLLNGLFR